MIETTRIEVETLDWLSPKIPPETAIFLSETHITQAQEWAKLSDGEPQQWRLYQRGLALGGLQQWLASRGLSSLELECCSLHNPVAATVLNAIANLRLRDLNLALVIASDRYWTALGIPALLLHLEAWFPHGVIWLEICEEMGWVDVIGGTWMSNLQLSNVEPTRLMHLIRTEDWCYPLSTPSLLESPDQFLLGLKYQPVDIVQVQGISSLTLEHTLTPEHLQRILLSWNEMTNIQEVMTVEQGIALLGSPQLQALWNQALHPERLGTSSAVTSFSEASIIERALINQSISQVSEGSAISRDSLEQWWQVLLHSVSPEMGWISLPVLSSAMRSGEPLGTDFLSLLEAEGIAIDPSASSKYRDLLIETQAVRLNIFMWPNIKDGSCIDWSLLLVLGSHPEAVLNDSIRLAVRDATTCLTTLILNPSLKHSFAYVQVVGELSEQFWVTVALENSPDRAVQLPPIGVEMS